jgi:hypothetical protein
MAKGQSAIEYLMTYGWAIVSVMVALGVMYSLGIFAVGSNSATGCTVVEGFSCTQPLLYSSGTLIVGFGQIGQTKTITATGCSQGTTEPTTWVGTSVTLQSGQVSQLQFNCPGVQGSVLGTVFQGTLWVNYTIPGGTGGTVTQEVAAVSVPVTQTGSSGLPPGTSYVPITVTNGQAQATPSQFQQMITFDPQAYTSNEAYDLGNIRFYQSGTELHSWCESGCARSSSYAVFWVLLPGGIAANGGTVVDMAFMTPNTMEYDGIYAGEAPQLTSTYAQYDNGASVFNNYWNFAGSSLPSPWTCDSCTVSDGLTFTGNPSSTQTLRVTPLNFTNVETDMYLTYSNPSPGCTNPNCPDSVDIYPTETSAYWYYSSTTSLCANFLCPFSPPSPELAPSTWGVITMASTYSSQSGGEYFTPSAQLNYGAPSSISIACSVLFHSCTPEIYITASYTNAVTLMQWVRLRAYPPNGAMPTTSLGNLNVSS